MLHATSESFQTAKLCIVYFSLTKVVSLSAHHNSHSTINSSANYCSKMGLSDVFVLQYPSLFPVMRWGFYVCSTIRTVSSPCFKKVNLRALRVYEGNSSKYIWAQKRNRAALNVNKCRWCIAVASPL